MQSPYIVDLNTTNFHQVIESSLQTPLLVHFWAEQEPTSVEIIPALNTLAQQYDGALTLALLNCEAQPDIARQFGVQALPTIALFVSGQPVDGLGGPQSIDAIQLMLNKHLPSPELKQVEQAKALIEQQQFDAAKTLLQSLSVELQQQPPIKLLLSACMIANSQMEEAKSLLDTIPLEYQDNDYRGLLAKIELHKQAAESPEIKQLEAALASTPDNLALRLELATQYHQVGRHEEALKLLWDVLATDLNAHNGEVKKHFMDILTALGQGNELTSKYRRQLYSILY